MLEISNRRLQIQIAALYYFWLKFWNNLVKLLKFCCPFCFSHWNGSLLLCISSSCQYLLQYKTNSRLWNRCNHLRTWTNHISAVDLFLVDRVWHYLVVPTHRSAWSKYFRCGRIIATSEISPVKNTSKCETIERSKRQRWSTTL